MNLSFCAVPLYFMQVSPACSCTPCNGRIPALLTQDGSRHITGTHLFRRLLQGQFRFLSPLPCTDRQLSAGFQKPTLPLHCIFAKSKFSTDGRRCQDSLFFPAPSDALFQSRQHSRRRPFLYLNRQLRLPDILQIMSIRIADNPALPQIWVSRQQTVQLF